jgi:hypothetical protein
MSIARGFASLACATLVAAAGDVHAQTLSLDPSGSLHRIDVFQTGKGYHAVQSTELRHLIQDASGLTHVVVVTGTNDVAEERDPQVVVDPISNLPSLVWIRIDQGSESICLSRFDGTTWSTPTVVLSDAEPKFRPNMRIGSKYLQIAWSQGTATPPLPWALTLDRVTLATVYPPASLTTDEPAPVPPSGTTAGEASLPPPGDTFFTMGAAARLPEEPPRLIVYGARDEPVPVNFLQGFLLPESVDLAGITSSGADFFSARLTVWYVCGDKLYYAYREPTEWSPTRIIALHPVNASDARLLIREMLARLPSVRTQGQ